MIASLLLFACALVPEDERATLLDPDGDGSAWPEDCDGSDAAIHPGAEELCDGVDQDCDGAVDDDASDGAVWYADVDGDDFGDAASSASSCEYPGAGWTADATDCDDGDATVYPGALPICGDRRINDCDGAIAAEALACVLDGELDVGSAANEDIFTVIASPLDEAGLGETLVGAGISVLGDTNPDLPEGLLAGGSGGDGLALAAWWEGSPYPDSERYSQDAALLTAAWTGAEGAAAGRAIASVGDVCGEDTAAFLVGSPGTGEITLVSAPSALALEGPLAETAAFDTLAGPAGFGAALGAEALFGEAWVAIGAPESNQAGVLHLDGVEACQDLASAYTALPTPEGAAGFGATVAAADLNGDGASDLLVSGEDDGASALWYISSECLGEDGCAERVDLGPLRGPVAALQVIDFEGKSSDPCSPDGTLDVVVGAPESGEDGQGQVLVLEGGAGVPAYNPMAIGVRTGAEAGDRFGASIAVDYAMFLDIYEEAPPLLLVGAPGVEVVNRNDAPDDGVVYGWLGLDNWCGEGDTPQPTFTLLGETGSRLGSAVTRLRDMDGDPRGLPELAFGAPGADDGAGEVLIVSLFPF